MTAAAPAAAAADPTPTTQASDLVITIESHGESAMMYLSGRLGRLAAVHAARACEDIPRTVQLLRVDLRRVHVAADGALETLALALGAWRSAHRVRMRFDLPARPVTA